MKLSAIIPAQNEEGSVRGTVERLAATLTREDISHEILIVNDHSRDRTDLVLDELANRLDAVRWLDNPRQSGFGNAVQTGLDHYSGDAVCIVMADASDDPEDVVTYYRQLEKGYECVFGSRFTKASSLTNYPVHKLILNRAANRSIQLLFRLDCNDITNALKCYRREVIDGVRPILSHHFNLTVELPLKAIVRGYTYTVVPVNWSGRINGVSKFRIKEMGSRYMFIVLYVLLERWLSRGDYRRQSATDQEPVKEPKGLPSRR